MTEKQFHQLDEMEQAEALWEHGVHIGERVEGEHKIILYQVDAFYLEVYYHIEYSVIRKFRTLIRQMSWFLIFNINSKCSPVYLSLYNSGHV